MKYITLFIHLPQGQYTYTRFFLVDSASIQLQIETVADFIYGLAIMIARLVGLVESPISAHPATVLSGLGMSTWVST